jgi:glycosyl transferase family 25
MINNINDIKNIFYINLAHRTDRKTHIENELSKLFKNYKRIDAIYNNIGFIGCASSHIKTLELALNNNYDHVLIFEDDVVFTQPNILKNNLNKFLENNKNWDVILLGANNHGSYIENDYYARVYNVTCACSYLVNGHYINKLLNNFKQSIEIKRPLDKHWYKLSKNDNWFLILPLTVTQLSNYSDIEKKEVNYSEEMLKL